MSAPLQQLVVDYLRAVGAVVEVRSYALVEALVPAEVAALFAGEADYRAAGEAGRAEAGGDLHLVLAFDAEVARENPGSEFVTFGHPLLDRLLSACLRLGAVRRRHALGVRVAPPPDLEARVARELAFPRSRGVAVLGAEAVEQHALLFEFRVVLEADDQETRDFAVLVDLHENLPADHVREALGGALWGREPEGVLPVRELCSPWQAYRTAMSHLTRVLLPPAAAEFRLRLRPHLERERSRVEGYYGALVRDLERRLAAASEPEKAERLRAKLEATRAEAARRVQDVEAKYAPRARVGLEAVTWYSWPRVQARVRVDRRARYEELTVAYDPLARRVQPVPCARCRRWLSVVDFDPDGQPVCPGGCEG